MGEGEREREIAFLAYTREFLKDAVVRRELHPESFRLMLARIEARLNILIPPPVPPSSSSSYQAVPSPTTATQAPTAAPIEYPIARAPGESVSGAQLGLTWALYLGAFFLLLSAVAFTAYSWQTFSGELKAAIIAGYTVAIFGISVLAERFKLEQAAATLFWLGTATVPVTLGAFGAFVLDLEAFNALTPTLVGNEWLAFVTFASAMASLLLYAWRREALFRYAALAGVLISPIAYFMDRAELIPVIPAVVALAYTGAHSQVKDEGWAASTRGVAIASGALAVVFAVVPVFEHLANGVAAAHGEVVDPISFTPFVSTVLVVLLFYAWRRLRWWNDGSAVGDSAPGGSATGASTIAGTVIGVSEMTALPEAIALSVLGALVATSLRVPSESVWALGYAVAVLVPVGYLVSGRLVCGLAATPLPMLTVVVLAPESFYASFFDPGQWSPLPGALLLGVALALLGLGLLVAGLRASWSESELVQVVAWPAGAAVWALAHALIPAEKPYVALAMTAIWAVVLVFAIKRGLPFLAVAAAVAAAVAPVSLTAYGAADLFGGGRFVAWPMAVYFALWGCSLLAVSLLRGRELLWAWPSAVLLSLAAVFSAHQLRLEGSYAYPAAFALVLAAFALGYRYDLFAVTATLAGSFALIGYLGFPPRSLDPGVTLLLRLPAFILCAYLWREGADPPRRLMRSASFFVIPVLTLGAARATDWDAPFVLFLLVLVGGSAFALVGFTSRIAGFASMGLLFVVWASFEFLAPFIALIPTWVGFGAIGLALILLGVVWERQRGRMRATVAELSRGWV